GTMNMNGYWNEPELTQETIRNGYVVTADLSYMDTEGYVYVLGRRDDVINYKGIKISPEEIEEAALTCDLIKDCACVPLKDELAGQVPKLFVVIDPERAADYSEEALFEYLKTRIDDNRMPRKIEAIEEIPRTYNGKIQRKKLMQ
ncbi:MAG: AMP-binding protein, partial [Lachnospiraceae bacterium]|nr:AMP-binding protein [Lachnospiraceae bacterium]